jgi:short-subunit dehydrogenase
VSAARPVTVITGASSGIGAELARQFAQGGNDLVLVARRKDKLTELAYTLASAHGVTAEVVALDLAAPDAGQTLADALATEGCEPRYLVNNAGFGLVGFAADLSRDEQLAMIDLNVRLLTDLSLRFTDSLARNKGGLLNVASVAGFLPGPRMAVYYATKAFVLSFSEALNRELEPRGIRVTVLCPGPVPTEFQARAGVPGRLGPAFLEQTASAVAKAGYDGLMRGKRLVVPGLGNKLATLMVRVLPRGAMLSLTGSRQKMHRRTGRP